VRARFRHDRLVPIEIVVPASPGDPREPVAVPDGVLLRHCPPLHPDDVDIVDGVPVTSPSRTLIDLAEELDADELKSCFERARARGLLDPVALRAARARVEWRPSLDVLDRLIEVFCP